MPDHKQDKKAAEKDIKRAPTATSADAERQSAPQAAGEKKGDEEDGYVRGAEGEVQGSGSGSGGIADGQNEASLGTA